MAKSSIQIINDYGLTRTSRYSDKGLGKAKYSIRIHSEPLLVQTDAKALGKGPADAIAQLYRERISGITQEAAPATLRARETARTALQRGAPWVRRRYSGGRIGTMVPGHSTKLFQDSGRLLESIKVGATSFGWAVNVATNRLDPETLNGGESALMRILERLKQFVPEWGDASALGDNLAFRRAINQGLQDALKKANERTAELQMEIMDATFGRVLRMFG